MRRKERIQELLTLLGKEWENNPDWRFFQLLTNLGLYNHHLGDHWFIEDEELLQVLIANLEGETL